MSNVAADLDAFAKRLRGLKDLTSAAAREAAPLVEAAIKSTAAAGTDIDGRPWPPKKDGTRALPNVAAAISAAAVGTLVVARLVGPYVWHQYAKPDDRRRQILPDSGAGVPLRIAAALRAGVQLAFQRLTK